MQFLIFDTETTGLPINWKAPMTQIDNWPRVIQLAWILCDVNGIELNRGKYLIRPEGWTMPTGDFWKENGFTHEKSVLEGIEIEKVLDLFIADLETADFIVSHNMSFDYNVLGAEMIRANKKGKRAIRICTKELSTDYCKIPGKYGNKWPTLTELHVKLFDQVFPKSKKLSN